MKRITAWLAISAMALNALWPLIAQARPATLVPVCTVSGVTHYVEVPGGNSPAESHHEHCAFCFVGVALPVSDGIPAFHAFAFAAPDFVRFSSQSFFVTSADARAPPVLP